MTPSLFHLPEEQKCFFFFIGGMGFRELAYRKGVADWSATTRERDQTEIEMTDEPGAGLVLLFLTYLCEAALEQPLPSMLCMKEQFIVRASEC